VIAHVRLVVALLALLSLLAACADEAANTDSTDPTPSGDRTVVVEQPVWSEGDVWYVASLHRLGQSRVPEWVVALDRDETETSALVPPAGFVPAGDEAWGAPIIWEFLVLAAGYAPEPGSEFAAWATAIDGSTQTLTVVRATAPAEANLEELSDGLDPQFYLVIGDTDRRVRAMHFNHRSATGRNTFVLDLPTDAAEASLVSGHDFFVVPAVLPAFPLYEGDYDAVVGAGGERDVMTVRATDAGVEVVFVAQPDGREVRQRWSAGSPFFDAAATADRISWRVDPSELPEPFRLDAAEKATRIFALEAPEAIAQKFRSPIRLDRSYRVEAGTFASATAQAFEPWAGYWWPLRQAPTAFGWARGERRQRPEDPAIELRDIVRADLGRLDDLGAALRTADRSSQEYQAKLTEYRTLEAEIEQKVWNFVSHPETGIAARVRRGEIDLTHVADFAPLTKFGLYLMANKLSEQPFEGLAWEVIKQYNPNGEGWWGKCNGWTAAAILTNEPREALTVPLPRDALGLAGEGSGDSVALVFAPGDLKALVSGAYYGVVSHFYGARYRGESDDRNDLYPDAFHRLISYYIGEEKFPLAFDTSSNEEVWNYPAYAYRMTVTDAGVVDAGRASINRATRQELLAVPGISAGTVDAILSRRASAGRIRNLDDLASVSGVVAADLDVIRERFSSSGEVRRFDVVTELVFSTDGVDEHHVDAEGGDPEGFTNRYTYSLFTDADGNLVTGASEWTGTSTTEHPDFAWLPYANNPRPSRDHRSRSLDALRRELYHGYYAPSENPFLYTDALDRLIVPRVAAPAVCNPDPDDCGAGLVCNPVDGTCGAATVAPSCGGGATADAATPFDATSSTFDVCAGRDSWFSVDVAEGSELQVELAFRNADGDIDLSVLTPAGAKLGDSTSTGDAERVSAAGLAAGTYAIRVYGYNGAANTVQMTVRTSEPAPVGTQCGDEGNEPNDALTDTLPALTTSGTAGIICAPGDVDHFAIPADAGNVRVTLTFTHADGDLDLALIGADGQTVTSSTGTSDTETLDATGGQILRVYGYRDATGLYTLDLGAR
jgi:hypothetical protein